ncbi:polysaccharide deacetylase family protein [Cohnella xylanilytica]|uniref:Polysaccharide deacetylase family protein n=2 Tax=Cohnella xylanilytica TaxID=557555 RepID=A0A841TPP8_9BACL|nr:polysaccharide deacetylase family protein [Cohnella xylanilytica]
MNRLASAAAVPVLLLSLAALPACGGFEPSASSGGSAPSASASASAKAAPPSGQASGSPAESASAAPASAAPPASPSGSSPSSENEAPEKTYKMNKNYDIVPIDKEKTPSKVVLLTFDDGPKSEETLKPILDALDKHHAKAIFFVNGYRVKEHPELLKEIDARGQTIGNHSWDHIKLGREKAETIRKQIGDVQDIVKETTGKTPAFFRPPHASGNADARAIAKEYGLLYMTWSNGSLDWEMSGTKIKDKTSAIVKNVTGQLHSGSNILMHELPWTGEALDPLLTELEKRGYSFVDPALVDAGS